MILSDAQKKIEKDRPSYGDIMDTDSVTEFQDQGGSQYQLNKTQSTQ